MSPGQHPGGLKMEKKIICNYLRLAANALYNLNRNTEKKPRDESSHVHLYNLWGRSAEDCGNRSPRVPPWISEPVKPK